MNLAFSLAVSHQRFRPAQAAGGVVGAPVILYTDAPSAPTGTGKGEGGSGGYLSIFGMNFGSVSNLGGSTTVTIGGHAVANYRYLGTTKVNAKHPELQQIIVQVGNLGGAAAGTALAVVVTTSVGGSNTDQMFTPSTGNVLFVSLSGNDATAAVNDITHPWRHLQNPDRSGAHGAMFGGDQIVIRGGSWSDLGFDDAWLRFRDTQQQGSPPTASAHTGWVHITAYPGANTGVNAYEDVHYSTPSGAKGGIQGCNSAYAETTGDYVVVSNLRMDVNANATSDAAPVNMQYSVQSWRAVNNELGPWPSAIVSLAGGISGHCQGSKLFGNHIHDMACTGGSTNHGIYIDSGGQDVEIAYNYIHDITGGNLIQFFDNVGLAGNNYVGFLPGWVGFTGMLVHHNWGENSGKYGLNFASGTLQVHYWNNLIIGATYSGNRFDVAYPINAYDVVGENNTFYNCDQLSSGSGNGQVLNSSGNNPIAGASIKFLNHIYMAGPSTIAGSAIYANDGGTDSFYSWSECVYYGPSQGWTTFASDAKAKFTNPQFASVGTGDFTPGASGSAYDASTLTLPFAVADDFFGVVRPQHAARDIGAIEKV